MTIEMSLPNESNWTQIILVYLMSHWGYCIGEMIDHAKTRSGSKLQISLKTLITTRPSQKNLHFTIWCPFYF